MASDRLHKKMPSFSASRKEHEENKGFLRMPINASPHFERAQAEYEQAQTIEQKIRCLKKMITLAPKHKGSENLLAKLRTRLKK